MAEDISQDACLTLAAHIGHCFKQGDKSAGDLTEQVLGQVNKLASGTWCAAFQGSPIHLMTIQHKTAAPELQCAGAIPDAAGC